MSSPLARMGPKTGCSEGLGVPRNCINLLGLATMMKKRRPPRDAASTSMCSAVMGADSPGMTKT